MKMDITSHSDAAKKAVDNSKKVFSELVKLIEKKSLEVIEEIKAQEKADLDQGKMLQKKLEEEITGLKKREGVLEDLIQTDDNIQFLQNYESVSSSSGSDELPSFSFHPYCSFEDVSKLICDLTGRLETTCTQEISKTVNKVLDLSAKRPSSDIVVGDRVRVKQSVVTPTHKWGSVTHSSIGVVKKIQNDLLTVDFPEQRNWTGVISEMERVTSGGSDIKDDDSVVVDFPGHANWKGILTEMELVTKDEETGPSNLDSTIKVGDKVRVKPSVVTPTHKWGAVTHKSIGVVKKIQSDSLTADFPEQKNWTGIISEMEIVAGAGSGPESVFKIGDQVRVKPSVVTPTHKWGAVTHKSIGVVQNIKSEDVIVDFPSHKGWKGILSEMELIKLTDTQTNVKQTIQAKEKELQKMKLDIASNSDSAKKTVENSKKVLSDFIKFIEKRSDEVIEKIKAQEKADLDQGKMLQKKLEEEITELKKREGVLEDLIQTDDNIQFLQSYESVSSSSGSDGFPSRCFKPCCSYPDVNKLVCELKEQLETIFSQEINKTVQKDIKSDEILVIDFPGFAGWKGLLSEMELVTDDGVQGETVTVDFPEQEGSPSHACFKIGNRVSVKSSVKDPRHGWGSVAHSSIGVIKRIQGESLTVDFPEQTDWTGVASEMELINSNVSEVLSLRPGVRVHIKPTINTPTHGWGNITKHSTGVVVGKC
ncbi:tripartite motif-containing 5-like isoform X1 [Labeo rohita]|uniref:Tripartite motif-containing 5-like isoform X1 n=1 Tax=Labeo rohita TaxID=84645 RepID=A0A498N4F6_LABRO|nr:tripartite motif-containing 5-like isoform X1 [Labeo rohita]